MRPTRKPRKRPALTICRIVSALHCQRSASMSGVKGLCCAVGMVQILLLGSANNSATNLSIFRVRQKVRPPILIGFGCEGM